MRHNRCRAVTKKWTRCGRQGDWRLFCEEHKHQWLKAVLIGIIAPVATGMIATWAYTALTATEPALSVKVPGQNAMDRAISQAKMEGTAYPTPSASEVVAKFYVLPTVTPELDTDSSWFALVSVSPFKPVNADFTFDAGDCRFLGYVTDFNPLTWDAVFQ